MKKLTRGKKAKKSHRLRVIGYWLLIIGLLFFVGCGFKLWRNLKKSVWSREGRVNWVMVSEDIFLVSLEPEERNLVVLEIPKDTEIEVTRGFGRYRIGAVYELGEVEGIGGELLRESVQESLGVPVDGWVRLGRGKGEGGRGKSGIVTVFRNLILAKIPQTNFSRWDIFRLWWETRKILSSQTKFIHLDEIGALKSKVLLDGSKVWEIEQGRLDKFFQDNFYEPKIREENLAIKVVNLTDYPGLAAHVARVINNVGGRVVEVSSEGEMWEVGRDVRVRCGVRSRGDKRNSFTVRKLVEALGCQFVEEQNGDGRAEVTVLVGEGYWRMLKEKW